MAVVAVRLFPWLAGETLLGERITDRWVRRLGVHGHEARISPPTAPLTEDAEWVVDGAALLVDVGQAGDTARTGALLGAKQHVGAQTLVRILATDRTHMHHLGRSYPPDNLPAGTVLLEVHPFPPAVTDLEDLVAAERTAQLRLVGELASQGVRVHGNPADILIAPTVQLEAGCRLWSGCVLLGDTRVGRGATVMRGCHLTDTHVGPGALLKPYTVAEGAVIGEGAQVGPFAHLRAGTTMAAQSKVGNFVETKNTTLGEGAKANHLSYLGDATIGAGSNIGAGTITCNYDGAAKHPTTVGVGVFVGTNTALVAPVTIGDGALIAAGSVITRDVGAGALAVARADQVDTADKGARILARNKAAKEAGEPR